uniref:endonuclease domain-containing 1 protein-like isoform X1 n=2 Tax=Oncorhynchus gorbuscha TaxID=8017 RepID=UPI001EAEA436|nr:endonuclease domain-containing 1 protein-like isoform X1 [Oncorhynchus gorbuscha]
MMGVLNHLSTLLLLSLLPPALSHVVVKFSDVPQCQKFFLEGTTPNLPGILVDGMVQNQNRYKPICQLFNTIYMFATLYDTTNRIPVFSAYTFSGPPTDRRPKPEPWMIEPQLNRENNGPEMQNSGRDIEYKHQAGNYDYINSTQNKGVNRGHLFPNSHAHDLDTQKSTFTLTNIVPQDITFNDGSWKEMERNVRGTLVNNCKDANDQIKAYVVTGAVTSKSNTLNDRVNIPDLLWTAYCCLDKKNKWMAEAHWGRNKNEDQGKTLNPETLGALEKKLSEFHQGGRVQVFPKDCPRGPKPTTPSNQPSWKNSLKIISSKVRNLYNSMMNRIG